MRLTDTTPNGSRSWRPTSRRILLVDDEPQNLLPLRRLFRSAGYEADLAGSGDEALAAIAADPPDAVLLDVMMPKLDGFEVLRRVRDDPLYDEVSVLMYTAAHGPALCRRASDLGADGCVAKGSAFGEIESAVRRKIDAQSTQKARAA